MIDVWKLGDWLHKLHFAFVAVCSMGSITMAYALLTHEPTRENQIFYRWIFVGVTLVLGFIVYVHYLEGGPLWATE